MSRFDPSWFWRDHAAAALASGSYALAVAIADTAGLIALPIHAPGDLADPACWLICLMGGLVYALVRAICARRRIRPGPLYLTGASRPEADYGLRYEPGRDQLFDQWFYR